MRITDGADLVGKVAIQIEEREVESPRQKRTNCALPAPPGRMSRIISRSSDRLARAPKVQIGSDEILVQPPRGLKDDAVQIDNPGRTVRQQPIGTTRNVGSNDADAVLSRQSDVDILASAVTSALVGGSPLFVGMNRALAPRAAIVLAGSTWLESLQMTMPNVSSPMPNTGIWSPAS